jgi:photosystem II stability/assembly factor-like uncharacterized protein
MLESTDGGMTWIDRTAALPGLTPESVPRAIAFTDAKHGWIVGDGGFAVYTADGGTTWMRAETATQTWLRAVHFTDARKGLICGSERIMWTDDGGASWRVSEFPGVKVDTVLRVGERDAYAATMDGTLLRTRDAGRTWQTIFTSPDNGHLTALLQTADGPLVVGDNGLVKFIED